MRQHLAGNGFAIAFRFGNSDSLTHLLVTTPKALRPKAQALRASARYAGNEKAWMSQPLWGCVNIFKYPRLARFARKPGLWD